MFLVLQVFRSLNVGVVYGANTSSFLYLFKLVGPINGR